MNISSLSLRGFRSYKSGSFEFSPGVNIVCGPNARGKTNLLEGIYMLSGAYSWRSRKRAELVNFESRTALISGRVNARGREFELSVSMPLQGKSSFKSNGVSLKRQYELSEYLKCVIFCPEDLFLVKGGPEKRRRFIDSALGQLRPRYAAILSEYSRLCDMKQILLKEGGYSGVMPEINRGLIYYGAELIYYRARYIKELSTESEIIHRNISGGLERLELKYKTLSNIEDPLVPNERLRELYLEHMAEHSDAERDSGSVLSGPHKDDLEIYINGYSAKSFASQGQARTAALSLKFGERELMRLDTGEYPVLLLDDVLSELDDDRADFVASSSLGGQTVITCCVKPRAFRGALMTEL